VRIVQAVLGALLPLLVLSLGLNCFSPRVAWMAAAVCAIYPALIAYTGLVLTETCASLLVITVAISAVRAARTGGLGWSATTGLAVGLTALCRAELAAVAAALCLAVLIPPTHSAKRRLTSAGVMLITFLLTLLPWTLRNYRALGSVVPLTTDGWRTLWIASYPERWLEWKATEPVLSIEAGARGPLERSQRYRAAALDNLRSHPGIYASMALRRLPLLFIGGHSNVIVGLQGTTAESRGLRRILKVGMLALNTLLLAAAGVGLWLCRKRWLTLLPLYVTLFVPLIVYLLLFAVPRYHIPFLPIAILFAADAMRRVPFKRGDSLPQLAG
jgi:4-amino-4-deoxy-L-arabinose transferase-like glycosyltransferase